MATGILCLFLLVLQRSKDYLCAVVRGVGEVSKVADDKTDEICTHLHRPLEYGLHHRWIHRPWIAFLEQKATVERDARS